VHGQPRAHLAEMINHMIGIDSPVGHKRTYRSAVHSHGERAGKDGLMAGVYVSMTGFRPKGATQLPRFWWHTLRSLAQARRAPGNLQLAMNRVGGYYHTLTIWRDETSMRAFLTSGAHRSAMKNFRTIGSGKTYGYVSEAHPGWDAAYDLWQRFAREV
jgi:heme-degrading monooxygenase HmoA